MRAALVDQGRLCLGRHNCPSSPRAGRVKGERAVFWRARRSEPLRRPSTAIRSGRRPWHRSAMHLVINATGSTPYLHPCASNDSPTGHRSKLPSLGGSMRAVHRRKPTLTTRRKSFSKACPEPCRRRGPRRIRCRGTEGVRGSLPNQTETLRRSAPGLFRCRNGSAIRADISLPTHVIDVDLRLRLDHLLQSYPRNAFLDRPHRSLDGQRPWPLPL